MVDEPPPREETVVGLLFFFSFSEDPFLLYAPYPSRSGPRPLLPLVEEACSERLDRAPFLMSLRFSHRALGAVTPLSSSFPRFDPPIEKLPILPTVPQTEFVRKRFPPLGWSAREVFFNSNNPRSRQLVRLEVPVFTLLLAVIDPLRITASDSCFPHALLLPDKCSQ